MELNYEKPFTITKRKVILNFNPDNKKDNIEEIDLFDLFMYKFHYSTTLGFPFKQAEYLVKDGNAMNFADENISTQAKRKIRTSTNMGEKLDKYKCALKLENGYIMLNIAGTFQPYHIASVSKNIDEYFSNNTILDHIESDRQTIQVRHKDNNILNNAKYNLEATIRHTR